MLERRFQYGFTKDISAFERAVLVHQEQFSEPPESDLVLLFDLGCGWVFISDTPVLSWIVSSGCRSLLKHVLEQTKVRLYPAVAVEAIDQGVHALTMASRCYGIPAETVREKAASFRSMLDEYCSDAGIKDLADRVRARLDSIDS